MKALSIATILLFANLAVAALPPQAERARQITAVVGDRTLQDNMMKLYGYHDSDGLIDSVAAVSTNSGSVVYRASSGNCTEDVLLTFRPTGLVGPADIIVNHTGAVTCK